MHANLKLYGPIELEIKMEIEFQITLSDYRDFYKLHFITEFRKRILALIIISLFIGFSLSGVKFFLVLADKRFLLIPKRAFSSNSDETNFLGIVQNGIVKIRGVIRSFTPITQRPPYLIGLLCLIPFIGAFVGLGLILYGIFEYKDKCLIFILLSRNSVNKKTKFNYKRVGSKYYLFSSGIDGIPNTSDDIYPTITAADSTKFGLIRK